MRWDRHDPGFDDGLAAARAQGMLGNRDYSRALCRASPPIIHA
jgi:hypothetical protein